MSFHPGYIESCHDQINANWYREQMCPRYYCDNLEKGEFIPCGTSGDRAFCFYNNQVDDSHVALDFTYFNVHCCGFVFGKPCQNDVLLRKWSCCHRNSRCTLNEMIEIPGCVQANSFNFTPNCDSLSPPLSPRLSRKNEFLDELKEKDEASL